MEEEQSAERSRDVSISLRSGYLPRNAQPMFPILPRLSFTLFESNRVATRRRQASSRTKTKGEKKTKASRSKNAVDGIVDATDAAKEEEEEKEKESTRSSYTPGPDPDSSSGSSTTRIFALSVHVNPQPSRLWTLLHPPPCVPRGEEGLVFTCEPYRNEGEPPIYSRPWRALKMATLSS